MSELGINQPGTPPQQSDSVKPTQGRLRRAAQSAGTATPSSVESGVTQNPQKNLTNDGRVASNTAHVIRNHLIIDDYTGNAVDIHKKSDHQSRNIKQEEHPGPVADRTEGSFSKFARGVSQMLVKPLSAGERSAGLSEEQLEAKEKKKEQLEEKGVLSGLKNGTIGEDHPEFDAIKNELKTNGKEFISFLGDSKAIKGAVVAMTTKEAQTTATRGPFRGLEISPSLYREAFKAEMNESAQRMNKWVRQKDSKPITDTDKMTNEYLKFLVDEFKKPEHSFTRELHQEMSDQAITGLKARQEGAGIKQSLIKDPDKFMMVMCANRILTVYEPPPSKEMLASIQGLLKMLSSYQEGKETWTKKEVVENNTVDVEKKITPEQKKLLDELKLGLIGR